MIYEYLRCRSIVTGVFLFFCCGISFAQTLPVSNTGRARNSPDIFKIPKSAIHGSDIVNSVNLRKITELELQIAVESSDPVLFNNLGAAYTKASKYDKAISAFQKALTLGPPMSDVYVNLSVAYERAERITEALNAAKKGVEIDPLNIRAGDRLCNFLISLKKFDEAVPCYKNLSELRTNDPVAEANYGAALMLTGRNHEAIAVLKKLISAVPNFADGFNALGVAELNIRKYSEAAAAFKHATEINPNKPRYRFNLALAQLSNKNRYGALSQYKFLKDSDPKLACELYEVLYRDEILFIKNK